MKVAAMIAAFCFSSLLFAADQMPCCHKNSASAMKCGATLTQQDVRTQLMKMKADLNLSEEQIVKIANALEPEQTSGACCKNCAKTEGKSTGCCDHSTHSDHSDH